MPKKTKPSKRRLPGKYRICRKRVFHLITLENEHAVNTTSFLPDPLVLRTRSRAKTAKALTKILLEQNNQIIFQNRAEYEGGPWEDVRLPTYQGKLIIGFRMAMKISISDDRDTLTDVTGKNFGLQKHWDTIYQFEDMPPVYFFGSELDEAKLRELIEKSCALAALESYYENSPESSERAEARRKLDALKPVATEEGYTARTAQRMLNHQHGVGTLHIAFTIFEKPPYSLIPFFGPTILQIPKVRD